MSLVLDGSGRVRQWKDKTGKETHLLPGGDYRRPQFVKDLLKPGVGALRFRGTESLSITFTAPIPQPYTVTFAFTSDVLPSGTLYLAHNPNFQVFRSGVSNTLSVIGATRVNMREVVIGQLEKLVVVMNGLNSKALLNDVQYTFDGGTLALDNLVVGAKNDATSFWVGLLFEMQIHREALA